MYLFQVFMAYIEQKMDMDCALKTTFLFNNLSVREWPFLGKENLNWGGLRVTSFRGTY